MQRYLYMSEPQLIEHRLLDEHAYLLLDQAHAQSDFWRELPSRSIAPAELKGEAKALPLLVATRQLTQAQRERILDHLVSTPAETPRIVSALFATDASVERLATHLSARLIVTIPPQDKHLFRYYDPRVFRHLLWIMAATQLAALFGPVSAWTWCDAQGNWQRNSPPQGVEPALSLRAKNLDLARIGLLERCLKALRGTVPDFTDDAGNVQARHVNTLLDAALSQGLTDEADMRLYVTQAVCIHPQIHNHPELVRRLQAAGDDDSYVGACSDLNADALARFARELSNSRKEHA